MIRKIFNAQFNSLCNMYMLLAHAFKKNSNKIRNFLSI